eukprot:9750160-Lingulodinium_polyedra.AAC.1
MNPGEPCAPNFPQDDALAKEKQTLCEEIDDLRQQVGLPPVLTNSTSDQPIEQEYQRGLEALWQLLAEDAKEDTEDCANEEEEAGQGTPAWRSKPKHEPSPRGMGLSRSQRRRKN